MKGRCPSFMNSAEVLVDHPVSGMHPLGIELALWPQSCEWCSAERFWFRCGGEGGRGEHCSWRSCPKSAWTVP